MLPDINTKLKKSTHNPTNQHTLFIIIHNNPKPEKWIRIISLPLLSVDKYHLMFPKVKIQNVHPCFLNDEFPNQSNFTP